MSVEGAWPFATFSERTHSINLYSRKAFCAERAHWVPGFPFPDGHFRCDCWIDRQKACFYEFPPLRLVRWTFCMLPLLAQVGQAGNRSIQIIVTKAIHPESELSLVRCKQGPRPAL